MPFIVQIYEWHLLRRLGKCVEKRKPHPDSISVRSKSPDPTVETLDIELRKALSDQECPHDLPSNDYKEYRAKLEALCNELDKLVDPEFQLHFKSEQHYPHLQALIQYLEHVEKTVDLIGLTGPSVFKLPRDPIELERIFTLVIQYNSALDQKPEVEPLNQGIPDEVETHVKKIKSTWQDSGVRRRAISVLEPLFSPFRCGSRHQVMLKISEHLDDTEQPTLDLMLAACPELIKWCHVRCTSFTK